MSQLRPTVLYTKLNAQGVSMDNLPIGILILYILVAIITVAGVWKAFTKAGQPGWASIIPIYNVIVMLEIAGKPTWWFILMLIPIVNFIIAIIVSIAIAERFGKSTGFGLGLAFLSVIFWPILGFGDAEYDSEPSYIG